LRQSPSNRFLVSMASLVLLQALSTGSASAAPSDAEQRALPEVKVERSVKLQPKPDAEVILPELKALFLSDGSVTLSGKGTAVAGAPAQGFDFEVDLAHGTYTTRQLDQFEIEERDRLQGRLPSEEEKPEPSIKAITPGNYTARVRVQTKDPVFIVLTETMTRLSWTVSSTGTVTGVQPSSDSCWAANPSSLGTHWFVSYCLNGALYTSAGRVCNDNRGDYYNYDFGFDDQITTASQYVYICGRNDAIYDYNWSHNDGGESALLIYGSVVLG
jgi:hypothetical protein